MPGETVDHKRTQVRRISASLGFGLLAWNPFVALIYFLHALPGWGFPVSAAIGAKTDFEPEWAPLDAAAKWLCTKWFGGYAARPYGVIWLCLLGLMAGSVLALITFNPLWLMLGYLGFCYLLAADWERGEFLAGALWALTMALGK